MANKKVFMIMPFEEKFFAVYEALKHEFEKDFAFSHAADCANQQNILKDIIQQIYEADVVIADLSDLNPNVFYELGIAHALNKKVIIITEDINSVPFDLRSYRVKEYSTHFVKFAQLVETLRQYLDGAISGKVVYGNPVSDFLNNKNVKNNQTLVEIETSVCEENEKGYLDFMAGIEENICTIAEYINKMASDMGQMSDDMNSSTEKISSMGANCPASFVKKEVKKVARSIKVFSDNLAEYNIHYETIWNKVESDISGLLENPYATADISNLSSFIGELETMKVKIIESNLPVKQLKSNSLENRGVERNMTAAIDALDTNLSKYLAIMGKIVRSIDMLLEKGNFVLAQAK